MTGKTNESRGPVLLESGAFIGSTCERRTQAGTLSLARRVPHMDVHEHKDVHVVFVDDGPYQATVAEYPCILDTPSVIVSPKGTCHRDRYLGGSTFLGFSLSEQLTTLCFGILPEHFFDAPRLTHRPAALSLLASMKEEAQYFDEVSGLAVEGLALELFAVLGGHYAGAYSVKPRWIERVRDMLDDGSAVTTGAMSQEARVHPMTLARSFRRHVGTSPAHYLRRVRAKTAARLLARSRLSLTEIAAQTGYLDQSTFGRAFRRATGLTPSQFRRLWQ